MKKISLVAVACISIINFSHAASPSYSQAGNVYLPINIGVFSPDPARNLDNGPVLGLGLGYNINNYYAVQTNLFYLNMDQKNSNNKSVSGYYWNAEARLNAANSTIFTPYAVAGVGLIKTDSAKFSWDYGVGLNIALSQNLSLDGSWRQVRQTGPALHDNVGMGGIIWTFGTPAAVVTASPPAVVSAPPAPAPVAAAPAPTIQQQELAKAQTTLKPILPGGVVECQGSDVGNQPGCVTFKDNQMIMHLNIKFQKAKHEIQDQYSTPIQSLGSFMSAYKATQVTLYGFASSEGTYQFNQTLSQNRAISVKNYLVKKSDITATRIHVKGLGIKNPIASNKTKAGRALNRRVEATLAVPAQLVQVNATPAAANMAG